MKSEYENHSFSNTKNIWVKNLIIYKGMIFIYWWIGSSLFLQSRKADEAR